MKQIAKTPVTPSKKEKGNLRAGDAADHVGHGFRLRAHEVCGEVAREERIGVRAEQRRFRVPLPNTGGILEGDERGGEIHLCVIVVAADSFLHESVSVEGLRWIVEILFDPV